MKHLPRRLVAGLAGLVLATGAGIMSGGLATVTQAPQPAQAAGPRPLFQLPFPCGETWRLQTYRGHDDYDIDMFAVNGATNGRTIISSYQGTVSFAGWNTGGGWMVRLNHGGGWESLYLHMISQPVVTTGQSVAQGQHLGNVGTTGNSSAPHLHYEQRRDGAKAESWFDGEPSGITTDGDPPGEPLSPPVVRTSQNCGGTSRGVDVASWGPDRLDVFARGSDNRLKHRWYDGGEWSSWEDLGGTLAADPTAVSWGDGRIDVFIRGTNGGLRHKWYAGGGADGWSAWEDLGGNITSAPDVASWGPGRLDVFARGGEGQLVHRRYAGGGADGWSSWEHLGGTLSSGPSAISDQEGRINVFARGDEGQLMHRWYAGGGADGWSSWEDLGGTLSSDPDAVSREPGRINVFARGGENQLVQKWYERGSGQGGWSDWQHLGGNLASAPGAVSRAPTRINVFAVNSAGALIQRYYTAGDGSDGWSTWQNLGTIP
jgi:hypothetical protein